MTTTKYLYRVIREHRYNGGAGRDELQSQKCLYCGYDREEAIRVLKESQVADDIHSSPGSYYIETVGRRMAVRE